MIFSGRGRRLAGSGGTRRHIASAASTGIHARATVPVRGPGWSRIKANLISGPDGGDRVADGRALPAAEPVAEPGLNGTDTGFRGGSTDSRAPRRGRPSRRGLRNWRVRSRLLLLIAIPTLPALILGAVRIGSSVQSAVAFQRAEERAVLASDITQLAQLLETERDQTVYYIALGSNGRAGDLSKAVPAAAKSDVVRRYRAIQAFYRQTDEAIVRFRAGLAQFRGAYPAGTRQEVAPALAGLNILQQLRQTSTKSLMPGLVVAQKYAGLLDDLIQMEDLTALGTGDPVLSQAVEVQSLVSRIKEQASEQRAILSAALLQGRLGQEEGSALDRARANQQGSQQAFDRSATTAQRELWNNAVSGSFVYLAASEEQQAAALQAHAHSLTGDPLTAEAFYDAMSNGINNQMGSVERTLAGDVITRANSLRAAAVTSALIVGAAVLAFLTLALVFTAVVARSMVGPLRRLRRGALEVAGLRLPRTVRRISEGDTADVSQEVEPIDVDSADEIGEVARAFDQVHREAVRLASNEAALRGNVNAMFVNLSRRSQSLVERQIRLVDDLELGEQDSERLGNLFQLDHLATRMRRNSENLLVLAGHEVSRRWAQAVALVDVLRAAVSEIEQYELDITDQGVGMGAAEMAHANWRLDNPPVVDVAVSRRMGLFVVARLAAGHGIRIRLYPAAMGGLTALVWLPDEVVSLDAGGGPAGLGGFESSASAPATTGDLVSPGRLAGSALPAGQDRSTAERAARAAAAPRFSPLRAETGDTAVFPMPSAADGELASGTGAIGATGVSGSSSGNGESSAPAATGSLSVHGAPAASDTEHSERALADAPALTGEADPAKGGVVVPLAGNTGEVNRLPIFESVESEWFRRGRKGADRAVATEATAATSGWTSPADPGWQAAEAAAAPVTGGTTKSGLPKRVPRANLVPGTVSEETTSPPPPARSAAVTKDRLASFQRGVREARAAVRDRDTSVGQENSGI